MKLSIECQRIVGWLFAVFVVSCGSTVSAQNLLIHGGGSMSTSCDKAFVELAGKDAMLVVIPTASASPKTETKIKSVWREVGFQNVEVFHTTDRDKANDPEFVKPLKKATAIWISGGSQNRLASAYSGTQVEKTIIEQSRNGVVIGGSSAGAAIMSKVMIAGGREDPRLSTGFDLLPGTIIDQHFLARSRINRLASAVKSNPERLGIGIDERTSLIVKDGKATVSGNGYVMTIRIVNEQLDFRSYESGESFELPSGDKP